MGVWWHALAFVTHERAKMSHKLGRNVTQAGPKCHTRAKMSHSHVIMNTTAWWSPISIWWSGNPGEFSTHSAEVWLTVNGGTTFVFLMIIYVGFVPIWLPVIMEDPITNIKHVHSCLKYHLIVTIIIKKKTCRLKTCGLNGDCGPTLIEQETFSIFGSWWWWWWWWVNYLVSQHNPL